MMLLGMADGGATPLRDPPSEASTSPGGLPGGVVDVSIQAWSELRRREQRTPKIVQIGA
jgi:hypothetical protein